MVDILAGGDQDAEPGARLTCHLLLRLFRVPRGVASPFHLSGNKGTYVKASCDRHLLAAAHDNIDVGAVLAVLKAMLALGKNFIFNCVHIIVLVLCVIFQCFNICISIKTNFCPRSVFHLG